MSLNGTDGAPQPPEEVRTFPELVKWIAAYHHPNKTHAGRGSPLPPPSTSLTLGAEEEGQRMRKTLMIALSLATAACTSTWSRPGAGQAELNRDTAECRMMAAGIADPAPYVQAYPQQVTLMGSANNFMAVSSSFSGALAREVFVNDCLVSKGWTVR